MLINMSNHPSARWNPDQLAATVPYGGVIDLSFPQIDPYCSDADIDHLVDEYVAQISAMDSPVVMVQGEFVFTFRMVTRLKAAGIKVVASQSVRRTVEYTDENGATIKKSEFNFAGFREY